MAGISADRVIYLDDYIEPGWAEIIDLNPVAAIEPAPGRDSLVYSALRDRHPHLTVYRKAETPDRLHYRGTPRIAPIIAIADEGWTISLHHLNRPVRDLGNHGFDPAARSMGGILIAVGPGVAESRTIPPLSSVHLYELMCRLLQLAPAPNDGRLDSVRVLLR
jgi:predicted AlkP superfamily pyrophosphatase or phosphodiesterase